jgi:hypothetical protein
MSETAPPKRKRGRPKTIEPLTSVTAWVPTQIADRLISDARRQELSVSRRLAQILGRRYRP